MQTYEVTFPLDSGRYLSVIVAAPDEAAAEDIAHQMICETHDAGQQSWRRVELEAREAHIDYVAADHWQPTAKAVSP